MDSEDVLRLLQIADLAKNWPELRPIHDTAMERLREIAKHPAHQQQQTKVSPVQPIRRV
jgi:hypothetical protein